MNIRTSQLNGRWVIETQFYPLDECTFWEIEPGQEYETFEEAEAVVAEWRLYDAVEDGADYTQLPTPYRLIFRREGIET